MFVLGLTGGTGAGKSAAAGIFRDLGAYIIDADEISRGILNIGSQAYSETVSRFGKGVLEPDGGIDRKALGGIVFSNPEELVALNQITHKYIFRDMRERLKTDAARKGLTVLDVPLLFSADFDIHYDRSAAVIADTEVRLRRITKRDGIDRALALSRINAQLSNEELRRRADYIIENNTDDIGDLRRKVKSLYERLIKYI